MGETLLRFEQVNKNYADLKVLEGVNFSVQRGDVLGILGPSGVGKSTLLKIVAGIVPVSGGQVINRAGRIGYVFQEPRLLPWRTARDNIAFGLMARGISRKEARKKADRMLEEIGLEGFGDHFPGELSGGMAQRITLARAFAIEPEILLLDEPFSALDSGFKEVMMSLLGSMIGEHRTTVLYVSHYPEEVLKIANRLLLLFTDDRVEELAVTGEPELKNYLQTIFHNDNC